MKTKLYDRDGKWDGRWFDYSKSVVECEISNDQTAHSAHLTPGGKWIIDDGMASIVVFDEVLVSILSDIGDDWGKAEYYLGQFKDCSQKDAQRIIDAIESLFDPEKEVT